MLGGGAANNRPHDNGTAINLGGGNRVLTADFAWTTPNQKRCRRRCPVQGRGGSLITPNLGRQKLSASGCLSP